MTYHPDTLAIHAGQVPDPTTNARAVPIYATTSYVFNGTEHAANLFGLREFGNIYTRIMNPTTDVFEKRIAELEGGVAALGRGERSGRGDAHDSEPGAGGGQHRLLPDALWRDLQSLRIHAPQVGYHHQVRGHPQPRGGQEGDRRRHPRAVCRDHRQPATGRAGLRRPRRDRSRGGRAAGGGQYLRRGNAVAAHQVRRGYRGSLGHQVDRRPRHRDRRGRGGCRHLRLDQRKTAKVRFPEFSSPDPSYHGLVYTEAFANLAFIIKLRVQLLRDLGPALSPFNAFLFLQGLETLPLRIKRHSENAIAFARWLQKDVAGGVGIVPGAGFTPGTQERANAISRVATAAF